MRVLVVIAFLASVVAAQNTGTTTQFQEVEDCSRVQTCDACRRSFVKDAASGTVSLCAACLDSGSALAGCRKASDLANCQNKITRDAGTCPADTNVPCTGVSSSCSATPRTCATNEAPVLARPDCCWSCRLPCANGPNDVAACAASLVNNVCAAGTRPTIDQSTCCPTCRPPPVCDKALSDIAECASGVSPTIDTSTGCPTCRPAPVDCPQAKRDACKANFDSLRVCNANENPTFDAATCCLTCRVPRPDPVLCRQNIKNYANLRECAANETPQFDRVACKLSCRRPTPTDQRPTAGRCTRLAFLRCMKNTEPCGPGEEPRFDANRCCPSCRPRRWFCKLRDIIKCRRNRPECATNQRPEPVPFSCCRSCRLPRPTCDPACAANEVCVRRPPDAAGADRAPHCIPKRVRRWRLRIVNALRRAFIAGADKDDITRLFKEIVRRFCLRVDNRERCERFKDALEGLICRIVDRATDGSTAQIECDVPSTNTARSSDDVLGDALADPESTQDTTIESEGDASAAAHVAAPIIVTVLTALSALMLLL